MHRQHPWFLLLVGILLASFSITPISAQEAKVHAIFFYSPSCPHCHEVMTNVLPPLREQYGEKLEILEVDTSQETGYALFEAMLDRYNPEMIGVPTLIMGEHILIGSLEIPDKLPGLIEDSTNSGGLAWPDLPGLEALTAEEFSEEDSTWQDRYMRDPTGSTLCIIVLLGLIASLIAAARPHPWQIKVAERLNPWGFLIIALIGVIAATYLSYVETTQTTAVCGPVGDCNAVQQSEFALLFGFLPMAVFGLLGYLAVIATFIYGKFGKGILAEKAPIGTFLLTAFGTLFSSFLTCLEPFVMGATCMWCLTSAISMGSLLLLSAGPGWQTFREGKGA